jgi:hypothetical protein
MIKSNILERNLIEYFKGKDIDFLKKNLGIITTDYISDNKRTFLDTYITIMYSSDK